MTPLEWLILTVLSVTQLGVVALAWFDLSQKLTTLLEAKHLPSALGGEAMPEPFTITDQEQAMAEKVAEQESQDRATMLRHSGRNYERAR